MALTDRRALKEAAGELLEQNRDAAKRAVLIFAGVTAAIPFAVELINLILGNLISGTSGIGSFQTRSALETVQTVLALLGSLLPSFIYLGYLYVLLRFAEGKPTQDGMLLQGFRNFWPVLRLSLLRYLLNYAVMMGGIIVGTVVLSVGFPGLLLPMLEAAMPYMELETLPEEAVYAILQAGTPFLLVCMLFGTVPMILLSYRLRMCNYALMEHPEHGAIHAMSQSFRITRGHCLKIFRLELSYWWYYLAQGVAVALMFGALIPVLLGSQLSTEVLVLIFEAIALAALFAVQYLASNKVELTFVLAYRELMQAQIPPAFPAFPTFPEPKDPFEQ